MSGMGPQVYPIPAPQPLGGGSRRAIAFGGGGEWFVCWLLGYGVTAKAAGVDLSDADLTIGTSAGSIMGSYLSAGLLDQAYATLSQLAANPEAMATMVVTDTGAESQARAKQASASATSTDIASIQQIGRAAMAAQNTPAEQYIAALRHLLGPMTWPSPKHHVTAVDCYTGDLVVTSADSGIDIATACAASSALPGVNGPVWLGDHLCMDGGISASSTHSDILAGAERVLIFSMMSRPPVSGSFGFTIRINPDEIHDEVAYLEARGAKVTLVCADPADGIDFMDPAQLGTALSLGAARAKADITDLATFWND
jgi:NTE family protein